MKNKRKLRLAALLAVLLLLFPAFAVEDDITDESDTSTTQTEETDQTAQLDGTDSIDPSADKPRVFDYEEVLTQTQIDTLEEKTRAIAEKYSIGVGIITIDDYTPYGDGAYDAAEQLYNELDLGASEDGDGVALLISLDDRDFATYAHGAKAEEIFSDAVQQDLEQYFLDNFGNDDWYGGFQDYLEKSDSMLKSAREGHPLDVDSNPLIRLAGIGISLLVGCVVAFVIAVGVSDCMMKSVSAKTEAGAYLTAGSVVITGREDRFTHTTETRTKIEKSSGSGGTTVDSDGFSGKSGKF